MYLGLGLGVEKTSTTNDVDTWEEVTGKVLHYDFSDTSTLFQNNNGTTAVSANNDPIGYAKNLVDGGLGTALTSFNNSSSRPIFKTGGTNSKSYAQFDNTVSNTGLRGGVSTNGTVIGGISDTVFSNYTLNTQNLTFIMVSKQDVEDISGVGNQTLFKIEGDGGDTYSNRFYFTKNAWGGAVNDLHMSVHYGGTPTINLVPSGGGPLWTTEDRLITTRTTSGTNNTKIQVDNNTEITGTVTASEDFTLTTSVGKTSVSIGVEVNTYLTPNTNYWGGRVYEIILFNRTLSDAELTLVKNYINTKYALW